MSDAFIFIITALFVGLISTVIYLIYLPFKIYWLRSGKLSLKKSTIINKIFIASICIAFFLVFIFRNHSTPIGKRIEKAANIKLPKQYVTISKTHDESWQDFYIENIIQISKNDIPNLIKEITSNKNFIALRNGKAEGGKPIWQFCDYGFAFHKKVKNTIFEIKLDTTKGELKYIEFQL